MQQLVNVGATPIRFILSHLDPTSLKDSMFKRILNKYIDEPGMFFLDITGICLMLSLCGMMLLGIASMLIMPVVLMLEDRTGDCIDACAPQWDATMTAGHCQCIDDQDVTHPPRLRR